METLLFQGFNWSVLDKDDMATRPNFKKFMNAKGVVFLYIVTGKPKRKTRTLQIAQKVDGTLHLWCEL